MFVERAVNVAYSYGHAAVCGRCKRKGRKGGKMGVDYGIIVVFADLFHIKNAFQKIFLEGRNIVNARILVHFLDFHIENGWRVSYKVEAEFFKVRTSEIIQQTRGNAAQAGIADYL